MGWLQHYAASGDWYLHEYREFSTSGPVWTPDQYLSYTYDGLDRPTRVAPVRGWQGYTSTYTYNAIGNIASRDGDQYWYEGGKPHAVTSVAEAYYTEGSYSYDANGNLITRTVDYLNNTYVLTYDVENRLKEVKKNGVITATFGYDGDGQMVTATVGVTTTYYVGNHFEKVNGITHTYYYHMGKRVAMRDGNTLYWLLTDRLGSTAMIVRASEAITAQLRYKAYGQVRDSSGVTTTTQYHFTGQREESTIGLYFYNARWYDPALGRFVQADSIVPHRGNPQALNRYSYVLNNPLTYSDPDGRNPLVGAMVGGLVGGVWAWVPQFYKNWQSGQSVGDAALNVDWSKVTGGIVGGAIAGGTLGIGTAATSLAATLGLGAIGGALGGQASALTQASVNQCISAASGHSWSNTTLLESAIRAGFLDPNTIVFDALGNTIAAGFGYGLNKIFAPILASYGDRIASGGVRMVRFTPVQGGLQVSLVWEGRTIIIPAGVMENLLRAIAAGSYDVASELLQQLVDAAVQQGAQQPNAQPPPQPTRGPVVQPIP